MSSDFSQLREFAQELIASEGPVREGGRKAIKRGAMNVKRVSRSTIRGAVGVAHAKHYAKSIDFDLENDGLTARIGPRLGGNQAFLGKILEHGTATSPSHPHLFPAADEEQLKIENGVMLAVKRALKL